MSRYKGNTDARRRAAQKYITEKTDEIRIRVPKGERELIKAYAASLDMSMNAFIVDLIYKEMK